MAAAATLPRVQLRIPLKALGDDRLARMAAEGDRDALAAIFERHHQALYRYCRGLLGSTEDAQDAVASAMARVVRSLPGEARTVALKPWLYRIAHNEAMRIARSRRPRADLEEAADLAAPDGTDGALARERLQMLLGDLDELSEHQRGALVLREMEGAGFARISEVFGVSKAAAKQTVYEARVCLADFEKGRAMRCEQITRALSDGDRRRLRGRAMRAHLRACHDCRTFGVALRSRPGELRALAPPLPAPLVAALGAGILGGGGGGGATVASAGGFAASLALPSLAIKGLVIAGLAAGGAGAALDRGAEPEGRAAPSPAQRVAPPGLSSSEERVVAFSGGEEPSREGGRDDRARRDGHEPATPAVDPTARQRGASSAGAGVAKPGAALHTAPTPVLQRARREATPGGASPTATQRREAQLWRAIETALGDGPPSASVAAALGNDWSSTSAASALKVAGASWPAAAPDLDEVTALIPAGVSVSELLERGPSGLRLDALAPAGLRDSFR